VSLSSLARKSFLTIFLLTAFFNVAICVDGISEKVQGVDQVPKQIEQQNKTFFAKVTSHAKSVLKESARLGVAIPAHYYGYIFFGSYLHTLIHELGHATVSYIEGRKANSVSVGCLNDCNDANVALDVSKFFPWIGSTKIMKPTYFVNSRGTESIFPMIEGATNFPPIIENCDQSCCAKLVHMFLAGPLAGLAFQSLMLGVSLGGTKNILSPFKTLASDTDQSYPMFILKLANMLYLISGVGSFLKQLKPNGIIGETFYGAMPILFDPEKSFADGALLGDGDKVWYFSLILPFAEKYSFFSQRYLSAYLTQIKAASVGVWALANMVVLYKALNCLVTFSMLKNSQYKSLGEYYKADKKGFAKKIGLIVAAMGLVVYKFGGSDYCPISFDRTFLRNFFFCAAQWELLNLVSKWSLREGAQITSAARQRLSFAREWMRACGKLLFRKSSYQQPVCL